MTLSLNGPFLSRDEFKSYCEELLHHIATATEKDYWASATIEHKNDEVMVRFERRVDTLCRDNGKTTSSPDETRISDEEDVEVVVKHPDRDVVTIAEYSIVLSPSYQVPVLYFTLTGSAPSMTFTIDDVYSLLVEPSRRAEMNSIGVMGAISYAEHPVTGRPAFFIHPCNTADALRNLAQSTQLTTENYLQLWLGLVGPVIGLHLPLVDSRRPDT